MPGRKRAPWTAGLVGMGLAASLFLIGASIDSERGDVETVTNAGAAPRLAVTRPAAHGGAEKPPSPGGSRPRGGTARAAVEAGWSRGEERDVSSTVQQAGPRGAAAGVAVSSRTAGVVLSSPTLRASRHHGIEAALRPLVRRPGLRAGVFGLDLQTGSHFSLSGDEAFPAASLIKVPIAIAILLEVDEGRLSFMEKVPLLARDVGGGSGSLQYFSLGTPFTIKRLSELMIRQSDNTATNMLIRRLGGIEATNERFLEWGLRQTRVRSLLPDLRGTNTTSPADLVAALDGVVARSVLTSRSREMLLDWMLRSHVRSLIPGGVGPRAAVANKTGDIPCALGDAGYVLAPGGRRYLLAVQVERPHNSARAKQLIRSVSKAVYTSMAGRGTGSPAIPARSYRRTPRRQATRS